MKNSKRSEAETDELTRNSSFIVQVTPEKGGVTWQKEDKDIQKS